MEDIEKSGGLKISELVAEAEQEPATVLETSLMAQDYESDEPVQAAPVITTLSFDATHSTILIGCSIRADAMPQDLEYSDSNPSPMLSRAVSRLERCSSATLSSSPATPVPLRLAIPRGYYFSGSNEQGQRNSLQALDFPSREDLRRLVETYKHEDGWMRPLLWESSIRFEPKEYYMDLILDTFDKDGLIQKNRTVQVADIFNPIIKGGPPVQRVLVRGDAGYGKSTLCQKAAYDWAHGGTTFAALPWTTTVVVLYKLRCLESTASLEDTIFELINSHYEVQLEPHILKAVLRGMGPNLLLLLDGYDEMDREGQAKVKKFVSWKNNETPFCLTSILVTSRPTSDTSFLSSFDKHFSIRKLSEEKIESLVKVFSDNRRDSTVKPTGKDIMLSFFTKFPETSRIERLIKSQTGRQLKLSDIPPLSISLICWLINQSDYSSRSFNIIYSCVDLLAKRCNEREGFGYNERKIRDVLWKLGLLCLRHELPVFRDDFLRRWFESDYDFLVQIGIMRCSQKTSDGAEKWEPVHKSFFDMLATKVVDFSSSGSHTRADLRNIFLYHKYIELRVHSSNGRLESAQLLLVANRERPVIITWDENTNTVSLIREWRDNNPRVYKIAFEFPGSKLESLKQHFDSVFKLKSVTARFLDMMRIFDWKGVIVSFTSDSFDKRFIKCMMKPGGENLFARLTSSRIVWAMSLSAIDGIALKHFCISVVKKMFGFAPEKSSCRKRPAVFLSEAFRYLKRKSGCSLNASVEYKNEFIFDLERIEESMDIEWNEIANLVIVNDRFGDWYPWELH